MRVVLVDDADEALAVRPDAVITNWRMPHMNGVETTRRIRGAYPGIAIVALSSSEDPEIRDAFLRAGADAVIDKRDMSGLLAAVGAVEGARS